MLLNANSKSAKSHCLKNKHPNCAVGLQWNVLLHCLSILLFFIKNCRQAFLFPIELSRDITEISPLWELLPFNLSWSPIGSRQSNDWPIVAKHANTTSSRQYKCDARDNYIRIFYFTLNSWWLQCVRSARDPSNRWISISTASPAWAWPTPRRRWTSPTVDIARTCRCGSRPVRGGAHCRQRAAGEPPLSWRRERRLAVPPNPTVAAFADLFPRGLFPPPFQYWGIRSFWPRGGRRGHVHLGLGEGRLGWIGARAARQLRAFRPPGGAHEGSIESCSGVGAHLESSGGACQE